MTISAIAHFKHDLDTYIIELRRKANLAATFILKDAIIRHDYLMDVERSISNYEREFKSNREPHNRIKIINKVKADFELTSIEYNLLRMKDYTTYLITDIFEDQGVIKYVKIGGGVFYGASQVYMGKKLYSLSNQLHIKYFKGVGTILMVHGFNNTFEALSPIMFETQRSGYLRNIYRKCAEMAGLDVSTGDLAYSTVDFSVSLYAAVRSPVLKQHSRRFVEKSFGEQPGTGRLFRFTNLDFISKWESKNTLMKIYLGGGTIRKAKIEFYDKEYRKDD